MKLRKKKMFFFSFVNNKYNRKKGNELKWNENEWKKIETKLKRMTTERKRRGTDTRIIIMPYLMCGFMCAEEMKGETRLGVCRVQIRTRMHWKSTKWQTGHYLYPMLKQRPPLNCTFKSCTLHFLCLSIRRPFNFLDIEIRCEPRSLIPVPPV